MKPVISPLKSGDHGADVANLQGALLLLIDKGIIQLTPAEAQSFKNLLSQEQQAQTYNGGTVKAVVIFQQQHHLQSTGAVDAPTADTLNQILKDLAPPYRVEGRVFSRSRAGVGGLRVQIVDKNVGADVRLTEVSTADDGSHRSAFPYSGSKQKPDLQARVLSGEKFLGASDVHYNASNAETLNVVLPDVADAALASEHETLTGGLSAYFQGKLRDLQETDERQDITYLANKTGWDARAVALAALADQFSARTSSPTALAPVIAPVFFYALFRAGLPANEDILYHTDALTLTTIWTRAAEQGVIPSSTTSTIPSVVKAFQNLSAQKLLSGTALTGVSSLKAMLVASRLTDAQQQQFATLYTANRTDLPTFWKSVGEALGQDTATLLQLDGKLAFLTINNASLMKALHGVGGSRGLSDPLQLAQAGYHRAAKWGELLNANIPIPKEIPGDTPEAKYAEFLAAQVRLSYPTAAVAEMVKSGDLPLPGAALGVADQVHAFLTDNQGNFEIGMQPVEQYIANKKLKVADETVTQVKRLQRVYQITTSDQALTGLMKRGIDAAYHVVRYDKDTFVQSFAADLGGADHAALTYDKSVQIHNAVLNIALSYLNARTAPAIGVHSPPSVLDPTPTNAGDVIAYATLESLFGSMDFCACEHCRSILSPAAYLVDLLLLLHADEQEWKDFCTKWNSEHGAPYPFPNQASFNAASQPQNTEISPLNVLLSRRPDIEHLPLTCENTNTALPYIDVVNETLEYFIANTTQKLSLEGYLGHDTNSTTSEDLLASPQFVMEAAYTTLRNERFPIPLPFHQPLENLRRYFNKFEVPLPLAMERFRKNDALERGANPYGWRDILMEEIGLSRDEYEMLTDSNTVPLWRMYGFPNGTADADVIAGLSNAKQFARRVGIPYDDLVALLKTRFINPNSDLIPKLERLDVPFAMLAELKTNNDAATDARFDALLAQLALAPDPAEYGGDIKAWVKNPENFARIMGLITLAIPAGTWAASKAYAIGDDVRPTAAPSESVLYYECTASGTSAASEPTWPPTPGNTYSDGTVVWTCRDTSSCLSFDNLAFRYADPAKLTQNVSAVVFVRFLRFICLWEKLGWTIEQTDAAICALYRTDLAPLDASDINDVTKLNTGFLILLPRLGMVIRVMQALNLTVNRDLLLLLACWSDIGTHGDNALYRWMFLNAATLSQDTIFTDDGYGEFLQKAAVPYNHPQATLEQPILDAAQGRIDYDNSTKQLSYHGVLDATTRHVLKAVVGVSITFQTAVDALYAAQRLFTHSEALRSAFNLTGDEYDRIVAALGYDANTPLTIPNFSSIFRRGWLARRLKLSVRELLLLTQLTGLDPFVAPNLTNPAILRLIELVQSLKDRSFKSTAALYLIWNQDLSGKSAPDPAQITELGRTLRGDFSGIEDQFAAIEDPNGDIARARMTLVYGQETSGAFFALMDDTLVVDMAYTHTATALENAISAVDGKIVYDDFHHRLSHTGLLSKDTRNNLKGIPGMTVAFQNAVDALFDRGEEIKGLFFTRYPELRPIYDKVSALDQTLVLDVDYKHTVATLEAAITAADNRIQYDDINHRLSYSGVLTPARRDILKSVPGVTLEFQSAVDALFSLSQRSGGAAVLATLQPELLRRRKRQQALQRFSAAAGVDLAFTQTVLDPVSTPYPLHADGDTNRSGLEDMLALETPGLAAQFFFRDTATGNVDQSVSAAANLDYARGGSNPLPNPGNAISGIWSGQVEAPEAGFYNFIIEADSGTTVSLMLDGHTLAPAQNGNVWRNTDPLELKAGMLYTIELKVEKVKDALSLKWETPKRAREGIPSRYLYPPTILTSFSITYIRFLKAASLVMGLGLTANEMAYFATHADYRINAQGHIDSHGQGWLNALPNADNLHLANPADAAIARNVNAALLTPLRALLDFARIKADISPGDESLLTVLKDPTTATQNTDSLLFTITRWNQTPLHDVLAQFGGNIAGLGHFDLFRRINNAFALVQKMGISAKALIQATTNEPTGDTVRDLQAALRARYAADDWRDVVRPINDEMRSLQRDALVAYILHQMRSRPESAHIDTPDKLFEYFLMDVQMDPCMQTSRIRHALSAVQLFIERCFMNLEPRVSPATLNVKQWEWMKRYRVWEANRKVFLYPENWLEPELRDDKSPFFKEIESELLQSDITEDSATTALLNYLSKLEEVAKLEPCGMYYVEPTDKQGEVMHLVARTAGAHRKYYYRHYELGYWTPWEQIKLDIEDNPVIPVVWNDRLFLFWLRILKQESDTVQNPYSKEGPLISLETSDIKTDPPQVTVQAVLCWSEYYNGKWQPAKTSDVNKPTQLETTSPNGFDRTMIHLGVSVEGDALRVYMHDTPISPLIYGPHTDSWPGSFLFYNTHSLPIPGEIAPVPLVSAPLSDRDFAGDNKQDLAFQYSDVTNADLKRDILKTQIPFDVINPRHKLQDIWNAPIFFADSRHVFLVTTAEQPVWVRSYGGYGIIDNAGVLQAAQIPPLVVQTAPPPKSKFWGDGGPIGPDLGVVNPAPMQRLVTEDAYIRQGLGTTRNVKYGDRQIGPSGAISTSSIEK